LNVSAIEQVNARQVAPVSDVDAAPNVSSYIISSNDRTERCGRPSTSVLGTGAARPHSLQ
jgi:hypothetical protein